MMIPFRTINANAISAPSPSGMIFNGCRDFVPIEKRVLKSSSSSSGLKPSLKMTTSSDWSFGSPVRRISSRLASASGVTSESGNRLEALEEGIEKAIYRCRFMAFLGTLGCLIGSVLCFIKGCMYVVDSFIQYSTDRGKVILLLIEAIDIYLLGTVMLVFGMGLYELFISNLDTSSDSLPNQNNVLRSNLFGMFVLKERPKWLEVKTVSELKTKLGHVIVMLLLIGLFDKSRKLVVTSVLDLLCVSVSIFLSSACLFLLSRLNE